MRGRRAGRRGAGAWWPGALVAVAATVAACGVPTGGSPQVIARQQLPTGLLSPPATSPSTTVPVLNDVPVDICLLNDTQSPTSVGREVSFPAVLEHVLQVLLAGPTQGEILQGYSTAIPQDTRILTAVVHDGIATVNLSASFGQITGTAQVQAVEQVVFTVVANTTPATGVLFEVEGQPIEVPVATGQQAAGPVFAWSYLPRSVPVGGGATTTTTPTTATSPTATSPTATSPTTTSPTTTSPVPPSSA